MTLEAISNPGDGGAGFHRTGTGTANDALKELQGLTISLLAGASADTKIDLAAIRDTDTIVKALNNNAGTITDVTSTMSINSVKATGTLTFDTTVEDDTFTVRGTTYTVKDSPTASYQQVDTGADNTIMAANAAAAINAYERLEIPGNPPIVATSALGVVTITAIAEGTGPNAYTLAETGDTITVSGATLSGGTATGGVQSTGTTNQIILFWFNKDGA